MFCFFLINCAPYFIDLSEDLFFFFSGTVTYRVVQVGGGGDAVDPLPQIVSTSPGFSTGSAGVQQGVQAVLTSPINGKLFIQVVVVVENHYPAFEVFPGNISNVFSVAVFTINKVVLL